MLILGRSLNQSVIIQAPDGTRIRVMLTEVRDYYGAKSVRLGFDAPDSYRILREEVETRAQKGGQNVG